MLYCPIIKIFIAHVFIILLTHTQTTILTIRIDIIINNNKMKKKKKPEDDEFIKQSASHPLFFRFLYPIQSIFIIQKKKKNLGVFCQTSRRCHPNIILLLTLTKNA